MFTHKLLFDNIEFFLMTESCNVWMLFVQQVLSPFVKPLLPVDCRDSDAIP